MIDVVPWNGGIQSPGSWVYHVCGRPAGALGPAIVGNQGISTGRADQYYKWLGGQYFVLDGGDGQAPVPPGNYVIRIHVNPPFPCTKFDRDHNRPVDPSFELLIIGDGPERAALEQFARDSQLGPQFALPAV